MRSAWPLVALALTACSDTEIVALHFDRTAVVEGDFDFVGDLLRSLDGDLLTIDELHTYDGRFQAPSDAIPVETLFAGGGLRPLGDYKALFLPCGMRGVGRRVGEGGQRDDGLVDVEVLSALRDAVRGGLHLYVSDWAYEWVSLPWADAADWAGGDGLDDAQIGFAEELEAWVADPDLAAALGRSVGDPIELTMNQSGWAVPVAAAPGTRVLVSADVRIADPISGVPRWQNEVPLAFEIPDDRGRVVFTAFHEESQVSGDGLAVLRYLLSVLATDAP